MSCNNYRMRSFHLPNSTLNNVGRVHKLNPYNWHQLCWVSRVLCGLWTIS